MRALLIMGPTASGKSALALALAERVGGEIVNADSMQVYRDLHVLTARPSAEEEARAPHHLYGHVDAAERYSVGRWQADALAAIAAIRARGNVPIIAGGTGLYFSALTLGLAAMPAPDPELRAALQDKLVALGPQALHADLAGIDPETAARLSPHEGRRLVRALEMALGAGRSISDFQAETVAPLRADEWLGVALTPDRAALHGAINARFEAMLVAGALEEARALAARGLDPELPALKAHGAPALIAHLRGEISLVEAAAIAQRDTRRYAKRQFTWIANQMTDWPRVAEATLEERCARVTPMW
jgi:tRNA dimethylallyltransferase